MTSNLVSRFAAPLAVALALFAVDQNQAGQPQPEEPSASSDALAFLESKLPELHQEVLKLQRLAPEEFHDALECARAIEAEHAHFAAMDEELARIFLTIKKREYQNQIFAERQAQRVAPGSDFPISLKRPAPGIPSDHGEYMRLMMDLMVLAFWSDATRICTFMLDHGQSNRYFNFIDGVQGTWHALSHWKDFSGKTEDDDGLTSWASKEEKLHMYNAVNRWHHEQVAHLLGRMKQIDDGHGSLLDNSIILYGSSLADGHEHDAENLPLLIAGNAGATVKTGRQIKYRENTSLSSFHLSTLHRLGVPAERFGETEQPMSELDG
ncbi:MAG: DUF1552 domain-containing protein [Planctomycetota bacterium]|nr:DUF1552 domain-containing protein [Planctomycetota bacterium]